MREMHSSRRSFVRSLSLLSTPLTAIAMALATLSAHAAAVAPRDLGVIAPSTAVSAVVWIKGSNDAAFDVASAALSDSSSASYHQWMQDADIAAYAPSTQDLATARASLSALGLSVDKVFDGGVFIRVSGSAAQLQAAFGTTIHALQSANGSTLLKASATPIYKGAHAELVGGISGLTGTVTKPFLVRQMDLSTGLAAPGIVPQAGTDPLAAFTSHCFGPDVTETMTGLSGTLGGALGSVSSTATGPSYLDPTTTNRPACGYTARQLVQHYGVDEAQALGLNGRGQTIVIVDAYGSPTALADLNTFSQAMGLPAATAKNFQVVYPDGAPATSRPRSTSNGRTRLRPRRRSCWSSRRAKTTPSSRMASSTRPTITWATWSPTAGASPKPLATSRPRRCSTTCSSMRPRAAWR
jgi:subtilase family serine protease